MKKILAVLLFVVTMSSAVYCQGVPAVLTLGNVETKTNGEVWYWYNVVWNYYSDVEKFQNFVIRLYDKENHTPTIVKLRKYMVPGINTYVEPNLCLMMKQDITTGIITPLVDRAEVEEIIFVPFGTE